MGALRKVLLAASLGLLGLAPLAGADTGLVIKLQDAIGPATAEHFLDGLERAQDEGHTLVILELDTPGGLDASMRDMIQGILASPVPVVTWVAPPGARAASAGTYLLYASHVAAMAPGTNLGAATPVAIGGSGGNAGEEGDTSTAMERKSVNDAVAYIRSLAELRGRNVEWAEAAVRGAESLPADEALAAGVIDLVAADEAALLTGIDGRAVSTQAGEVTLNTTGLVLERHEPGWRTSLL
ncbi:MAG: nodulation protein NfeD, partial [Steroidobacteraceae bacterium]